MTIDGTAGTLPSAPDHLFTWLDVEQHFALLAETKAWPGWLVEVSSYWDSIRVLVVPGTQDAVVWAWLRQAFGPLTADEAQEGLVLDQHDRERLLPVTVEPTDEQLDEVRIPRWKDRLITAELGQALPAPAEGLPEGVQLCVFHSFKGGVGRTLHCLAVARRLSEQGSRVLLIDGDLEAPGITWMVEAQGLRMDFAYEDFLALAHGSLDGDYAEAIDLGAKYLANQEMDRIVVMPARRSPARLTPPHIEPVDLLTADRDPYVLATALARLAKRIEADVVLVDLRAGVSELSAPLLLDPRVLRVFVSTISDQSVRGTAQVLDEVARKAPANAHDPDAAVLLTQFSESQHQARLDSVAEMFREKALRISRAPTGQRPSTEPVDQDAADLLMASRFDPRLLNLPASWNEVLAVAAAAALADQMTPLIERLRASEPPGGDATGTESPPEPAGEPDAVRERLAAAAEGLKFADTSSDQDFLVIEALDNLIETHRTEPPIEVVVGAKGSGKTFTFLQLCSRGSWQAFARAAGVSGVQVESPAVPVFWSVNLGDSRRDDLVNLRHRAAAVSGGTAASPQSLTEFITEQLSTETNEPGWRRIWLACFARALGFAATADDAEAVLTEFAKSSRAVFVVDGLEDLFPNFTTDESQRRALRALLTGCTEWFRSLRGRPLGLVVFIRRDLAQRAITQNFGQFESRYRNYALRWNRTEALRLAAWVCQRSGALHETATWVKEASTEQLSAAMTSIWGDRMGSAKSKEARSELWFYAALSDFTGQIQARDIVFFLAEAARESVGDKRMHDRILTPAAMRSALPSCSVNKIDDIGQENPPVKALLDRLRALQAEDRRIPFTLDTVGLTLEEARLLENNGVVFREDDQYWIPEIFRHGLGFRTTGRPRVLAIANLVRSRNDPV